MNFTMVSEQILDNDYRALFCAAQQATLKKEYNKALGLIDIAATTAYTYSFLKRFSDPAIEELIETIAERNFSRVQIDGEEDTVVFYDYFGYDNRGLTQQYLRAVMHMGKRIVYILESKHPNFEGTDIYQELSSYGNVVIYELVEGNYLGKIAQVVKIVQNEKPSRVLMHLAPWDVVAVAAFYLTEGIERYQINLTDHAFWLGVNITDYSLEFRSFGCSLSIAQRGIDRNKIRMLPFYPITNHHAFEGFPEGTEGKRIIFSGASIYKILGENLLFLDIVKEILSIDDSLVFVFAGSGNRQPVDEFIQRNNLQGRFFLIGNRKDISAVLEHSNYFLSTFPFTGALMNQIAAVCKVPSFFFSTPDYQCNNIDELHYKATVLEEYNDVAELVDRFKKVYLDDAYLKEYGLQLSKSMITPLEFAEGLKQIFDHNNPYQKLEKEIDTSKHQAVMFSFLIDSEQRYNPQYSKLITDRLSVSERSRILPVFFHNEQKHNWKHDKVRYIKNIYRKVFPKELLQ